MIVYFSSDGRILTEYMRPNKLNDSQCLAFSGSASSYLQVYDCYQLGRGVLIHKSTDSNSSSWCFSFIGTNYSGQITIVVATPCNI